MTKDLQFLHQLCYLNFPMFCFRFQYVGESDIAEGPRFHDEDAVSDNDINDMGREVSTWRYLKETIAN